MATLTDQANGRIRIHPSAVVDSAAEIDAGVEIGPFCFVGKNVFIGAGTVLHANVHLIANTRIGTNCQIFQGTVIGGPPQDTKYQGEDSYVVIGDNNVLREYVTIHRATGADNVTRIGNDNMLMAYSHVAHNCELGSDITIASYGGISGHVLIDDHANIGGLTGVHQKCRIGRYAMIGGQSGVGFDIPPYMLAVGRPARVYDINTVGLRRAGIAARVRSELRQAYKLLYRSNLNMAQALDAIEETLEASPELERLIEFIDQSRRGRRLRGNDTD